MLLGAVLIVGLVVIGLFMFYYGTNEEKQATASMAYWSRTQPIAIREVWAGSAAQYYSSRDQSVVLLVLKNIGKDRVVIKGLNMSNSTAGSLYWGGQVTNDQFGRPYVDSGSCSAADHAALNCNLPLDPGQSMNVVAWTTGQPQCGLSWGLNPESGESVNSLVKSISSRLFIYYQTSDLTMLETSEVKLFAKCNDYFLCSSSAECDSRYGLAFGCGPSRNCWFGE